jgi:hypothetical protein
MAPVLTTFITVLILFSTSVSAVQRGLAVPQTDYVPMSWDPSQWGDWNSRIADMHEHTPKYLMAFTEPDVANQANMDPDDAAQLFMDQIFPWASKDVLLGSPAIVGDLDWMDMFLDGVRGRGGHVDFIRLHWYVLCTVYAGFFTIFVFFCGAG